MPKLQNPSVWHDGRIGLSMLRVGVRTLCRGCVRVAAQHGDIHVCIRDRCGGGNTLFLLSIKGKRSPNKDTFPEKWEIGVAGHVESGDESRPTAVREVAEELGVICVEKDLRFLGCVPMEQACMGGCNCFEDVRVQPLMCCEAAKIGRGQITQVSYQAKINMARGRDLLEVPGVIMQFKAWGFPVSDSDSHDVEEEDASEEEDAAEETAEDTSFRLFRVGGNIISMFIYIS